ncbi:HlyD family type I secretion periplasmic adaptor subunit [Phytopseudomonas dryadis]|uniref:Membrane fusion protein (MFP) family protein n=1 Tax=Phytopseudomonas dryadis TaxID=2487520 RepID=A0A4Q9QVR5_9GAMM|nr:MULTISPECIES: HlyD family type I secretion periplasmic adaptor subunit [Pseudomonas]TBU86815.1 HlyD family type I secretion periplasmic adaptor subunit [Pseudomonas dryadis]TBV01203.1 HlyD family type I secretion periplasmic adaptor subunit [Pseudomonas dryadis]TBV14759.1 HlyD family type I secretion periplasmic adaptor subunit [Pseudomonas sp. FRB 230]
MNDGNLAQAAEQKQLEQQAFERLHALSAIGAHGRRGVDRLFRPFFAAFGNGSRNWQGDAEQALDGQRVLRARGLLYGIALSVALLLLWSAFATVDEVTRGEGKVIPSRQLQVVQAVDGGVVEALFVEEGATVRKDDLLVRIDPTRFVASFQEGSVRIFALRAKVERLLALIDDKPYQPAPRDELSTEQAQVLDQERSYYHESLKELDQRLSIAREQRTQRQQELSEVRARLHAAEQSYRMSSRELSVTTPLLASGAVSEMDILRLQRDQAAADGERRQAAARSRQIEASIQEAEARLREVELTARNQWRAELSEATAQLNSLDKNINGLADRVKFSEIRSPVNGTVQRVLFNTIGGVVQPGHAVIEIVPSDDRLLVEAKVSPKDIAFLRPGLPATIKLHAYDFSIYGGLEATLQHISADTITDERDNTFYLVRVVTRDSEFAERLSVIPGMTAQLDIMTGKKSILAYLLKPVLRAKANALSER